MLHGCLDLKTQVWQNTSLMNPKIFFHELRRRNVHKVAIVYGVIAWLLIEAVSLVLFGHEERASAMTVLLAIVTLGFLLALYISWAFEATPEGLKRTANVPSDTVLPTWSRRKFAAFIIVTALLAASLLAYDLLRNRSKPISPTTTATPVNS
jgi:hypothetical protein